MKKFSISALLAAGLLAGGMATGASAADLGGDCCADLEERIAELEATTARKGNRKVSLTVSGWVAEQIKWFDDGVESNAYVEGIGTTLSSHVKFTGQAQINSEWSAGYVLQIETDSSDTLFNNQDNDEAINGLILLQSYWFVKSERLGKMSLGQISQASDNTAILVDGSGSLVPANWVIFDNVSFFTLENGVRNGAQWADYAYCQHTGLGIGADCNGVTTNAIRYDSPTFGGFSVSASWGEDDFWDVAARYAGDLGDIKLAVAAAYSHQSDDNARPAAKALGGLDVGYFQVGAYAMHSPTGLFVYGAYGAEDVDTGDFANAPDGDHYYLKAGLRRKLNPLGHTVFYGEYAQHDDQYSATLAARGATSSEMQRWGLGVVQEIDAAAMSVWLSYRNIDGEYSTATTTVDADDLDIIKFGALINF